MAKQRLRVHCLSMSVDGYAAGPNQTLETPLGVNGESLHDWVFTTPSGRRMMGQDPGDAVASVDDDFFAEGFDNIGAHVMGRNMFGPVRGEWGDSDWRGWWGDNPVYHHPVFVLTHYPHAPIEMEGGTTFYFVTDGIESALSQAFAAAGGQDVRLGGGSSVIQQYLAAGLVDDMHVAIAPILLGGGERLFGDVDLLAAGYRVVARVESTTATHVRIGRV